MSCNCGKSNCSQCRTCPPKNCGSVCASLVIVNSWNIPACTEQALLSVPGLCRATIGSYIWSPIYGAYKITSFNQVAQQITVLNECLQGNSVAGTPVPPNTEFMLTSPPVSSPGSPGLSGVFPYLAVDFITPDIGDCIDISVTNTTGLYVNQSVQISNGTYLISSIPNSTTITICNEGNGETPGTTKLARTVTGTFQYPISNVALLYNGGWIQPKGGTWAYQAANQIIVPSDATTYLQIGDKIWIQQSSVDKYFYVTGVLSSTVIEVNAGSDFAVTNVVIENPLISRDERSFDFPDTFNWIPTLFGFSADPTNTSYKFTIKGRICTVFVRQATAGTSNNTNFAITSPVTARSVSHAFWGNGLWGAVDNSVPMSGAVAYIQSAGTYFNLDLAPPTITWTNTGAKRADFELSYEI